MPTGFTTITASRIQDASGELLASGRVTFYPVSSPTGGPVSAIAGGGGGPILQSGIVFLVVGGAITTDLFGRTPQVADVTLTTPVNIAYRVTITDAAGIDVQGPGYGLVQPSGSSWSLDTYVPIQPLNVTVQAGPQGPPGATGPAGGGGGIVLMSATGTPFTLQIIGGRLALVPSAPVLVDTVTGTQYQVGIATDISGISRPTFTATSGAPFAVASLSFFDQSSDAIRTLVIANGRYVIT